MALSCGQAGKLSVASAGGHASEAERLGLEAHLAACARCSAEHAILLGTTRALRAGEPEALSAPARERVRRAAIAHRAHAPERARRSAWPLAGGAVLAMAAGIAIWISTRQPAEIAVVAGDVLAVPELGPDGRPPAGRGLIVRSEQGGEVKLADASAALARKTELVWRLEKRVVELREGSLTVDVEHRKGQHFEVHTPLFIVEVVGTRFSVDRDGVQTERGTVRVRDRSGGVIGTLEAGQSWRLQRLVQQEEVHEIPDGIRPDPPVPPATATLEETAAYRLGRARRALAHGKAGEARRLVEPLFRLHRDVAAEARAIHAESYLSEGRYSDALIGYRIVFRDFPSMPQAESALFAVAQLESEHGRLSDAQATLQRYLARYPHGRFAKEAAARLVAMPSAPR